ncbi:MAG: hypothetical protein P4L36_21905 [Holophaga sp.]|nr:hypothetical protein [Holophaga sp.]
MFPRPHPMAFQVLAVGAAALTLAAVTGCGGRADVSQSISTTAGAWTGSSSDGSTVYGLVLQDNGTSRWLTTNMLMADAYFTLTGSALSGDAFIYTMGSPVAAGTAGYWTLGGTGSTGPRLQATQLIPAEQVKGANGTPVNGTTFTLRPDPSGNVTTSLDTLAGTYTATAAQCSSGQPATLTVAAGGTLTGGDGNGTLIDGRIAQVASQFNAYSVSFTYTPTAGVGIDPVTMEGYAYYRPGATPTLIMMADNGVQQYSGIYARATAAADRASGAQAREEGSAGQAKVAAAP